MQYCYMGECHSWTEVCLNDIHKFIEVIIELTGRDLCKLSTRLLYLDLVVVRPKILTSVATQTRYGIQA